MLVSVVVPCFNEVEYMGNFLKNFFSHGITKFDVELIIADGESDDGTKELLCEMEKYYSNLVVVANPERIVSCGLNRAIMRASGEIVVRLDVHTTYAQNYIENCVESLISTDAKCVGGPWKVFVPEKEGIPRAIALGFKSKIGSGSAKSRNMLFSGEVDTVYLGAWWKTDLIEVGLFDENLVRNQDDELCLRIRKLGGSIWQSADIKSTYYPRTNFITLFNQWLQYGYWRPVVIKKHRTTGALRQLIPSFFVISIFLSFIFLVTAGSFLPLAILTSAYLALVMFSNRNQFPNEKYRVLFIVAVAVFVMHIAYGLGFLWGVFDSAFRGNEVMSRKKTISR